MNKGSCVSVLLALALMLAGCSGQHQSPSIPGPSMNAGQEAGAMASEPAAAVILEAIPSGTALASCEEAEIDYSHTQDGYVMARYTGTTDKRLKVLVKGPSTTYSYNLDQGSWTTFPLSDGDGAYQVGVYKNITDSKYATVLTADFSAVLQDEFAPFLRPNQYVNYSHAPQTVQQGLKITQGIRDPLHKVAAVYDYVVTALTYDEEKATGKVGFNWNKSFAGLPLPAMRQRAFIPRTSPICRITMGFAMRKRNFGSTMKSSPPI